MTTSRCLVIALLLEVAFFSLAFFQLTTGPGQMLRQMLHLQMTRRRSGNNQSKRPQGIYALLISINATLVNQGATLMNLGAIVQNNSAIVQNNSANLEEQGATLMNLGAIVQNNSATLEEQGATLENLGAIVQNNSATLEKQGATLEKQGATLEKQGGTLQNLVGYNKNRDEELEVLLSSAFYDYLRQEEWQVEQIKVSEIYNTTGSPILEWDFIFFATHQDYEPTLFLGEAKQLAKSSHGSTLSTKALKMTSLVLPGLMERKIRDDDNEEYKNFARKFLKHMIAYPDCRVVGVLAYNGNEPGLEVTLSAHPNVSFVSRASGEYLITLRGPTKKPDSRGGSNHQSKKQHPPSEPPTSQKQTIPYFHH